MSIKNQVAILIIHIHMHNNPTIKTINDVINITSTEAELFVIRYGINQATQIANINYIISTELRKFFIKDCQNSIKFWEYSSCKN